MTRLGSSNARPPPKPPDVIRMKEIEKDERNKMNRSVNEEENSQETSTYVKIIDGVLAQCGTSRSTTVDDCCVTPSSAVRPAGTMIARDENDIRNDSDGRLVDMGGFQAGSLLGKKTDSERKKVLFDLPVVNDEISLVSAIDKSEKVKGMSHTINVRQP